MVDYNLLNCYTSVLKKKHQSEYDVLNPYGLLTFLQVLSSCSMWCSWIITIL
jgi:hypothetical protein